MECCGYLNRIVEFAVLISLATKKSNDPQSPSYVPSIFPEVYKKSKCNHRQQQERCNRVVNKKFLKMLLTQ